MRWRRRRKPILSEEELDLLFRLHEGEQLDFTSEEFWMLDRFRRLGLIEPKVTFSSRRSAIRLTEFGHVVVSRIKARRWVEEHGTDSGEEDM